MDFVYIWVDGVHVNIRLEEDKLCLLVVLVRAQMTRGQVRWLAWLLLARHRRI